MDTEKSRTRMFLSATIRGQRHVRVRRTHHPKLPLAPVVYPRRAADFSHCAYSRPASLVHRGARVRARTRNCFGSSSVPAHRVHTIRLY